MDVVFFDMGGQIDYGIVHGRYMASRTVYMIMVTVRDFEKPRVEKWLQLVASHAPMSHVIVVLTKVSFLDSF